MLELLRNKKILVVVAHPDDELLGLGGTLNKLVSEYNSFVRVVILGEGLTSRSNDRDTDKWNKDLEIHRSNIKNAQQIIGYQELSVYQIADNRFDSVDLLDIIKLVENEKTDFIPDYIFTHHGGDVNIDHQKTFEAVITASRPMQNESTKGIFTFETPSGTEWRASTDPRHFIPNIFIELTEENIFAKIRGMECYQFEKRAYPHPRSPEALNIVSKKNGIQVGFHYAEAFMLVRLIS
jgi:LmbE family N-acetylglucosaminyl deacetylase